MSRKKESYEERLARMKQMAEELRAEGGDAEVVEYVNSKGKRRCHVSHTTNGTLQDRRLAAYKGLLQTEAPIAPPV